jgi:outer membrane protein
MTRLAIAAPLALALSVAPAFAQAPAPTPSQPVLVPAGGVTPVPVQQPPPAIQPVPVPAAPTPGAPAAAPAPAPFPAGAKLAFIDFQRVAQESVEGQNSTAKINALVTKKQAEGAERAKTLQSNQQKLAQSGGVLSDSARAQLEKDIERQTREGERFQQDAQAEINELQQELQLEFQKKISPLVQQVAQGKGIQILFSRADAGIVWWDPGIDVSADLIKMLDAITPRTAAPAAARPAAPAAPRAATPTGPAAPRPAPAAPTPRPVAPAPAKP